jgi:hypothetical protein
MSSLLFTVTFDCVVCHTFRLLARGAQPFARSSNQTQVDARQLQLRSRKLTYTQMWLQRRQRRAGCAMRTLLHHRL